ncbi:hypothetical protein PIB30_091996 [Stylosanthes scabra]|uniref:Transposase n=1 Tax=Stylosanthes scabra TaxID=79078 RepID=A0ABU6RUY8_9FABA|nr:hypothetical protein [Stylosanthes scabra]
MHGIRNKGAPHGWIREDLWARLVEFWQQEDFKKLKQVNKRNWASSTGGSLHTGGSTTYEATRERMALELRRAPTQSEVFARTHTRKEDREWEDKRSLDVNDAYEAELKRLQDERQVAIDAGDPDDDDTASGPPDLREQAEAHAQSLAAVEAVCGESADLGVHRADAVVGGLRLEESLLRHVQLPDSDAEWRIRLRFDARHASPTISTATTASCSITDSPTTA